MDLYGKLVLCSREKKQFDFVHTFNECIYRATESPTLALQRVWCEREYEIFAQQTLGDCSFANKSSRCMSREWRHEMFFWSGSLYQGVAELHTMTLISQQLRWLVSMPTGWSGRGQSAAPLRKELDNMFSLVAC